ncbi:MAG: diguanylate cyclase [Nitrospirota bacterium]
MKDKRILLVEDDKLQAEVTKTHLESVGYEVFLAADGKSAIKSAKTDSLDAIILDLILPDMNGNEVSRWLKANEETRGIPIIMLTAQGSTVDKIEGLHAGADDYLLKPYNENELHARIYALLRTKALQDELREKNRQLEEVLSKVEVLAITDPLTQLRNRRHFEEVIEKEFARTIRYHSPSSCLMIDIDHFKAINDSYGHRTGDLVLKEIARIIVDTVRKVDTVARWGGEEFVVLLPRTNKEQAFTAAFRILKSIGEYEFPSISQRVTASIGIASMPESSVDTAEKLVDASDQAMYRAKTLGRSRIEFAE